ncbi:MAG: cupredoxin domain-containing protein [Thermoproteota archaeon]|nr:cupredoxin domain-containing protein [Thermoproteota archaeon]
MFLTTVLTTRILIIVSLAIVLSLVVLLLVFPSEQQGAMAQQDNNTTRTTNTTTPITTAQSIMPASSNKTFYVFSAEVEGLDEATARIPGDMFTPPIIVVNRGDNVTVNFYNTEQETEERHSFTIDAQPYRVDIDIAGGESGNATFTAADQEGIFPYYCRYHLPTMVGQLVVLSPTTQPEQQQQQEEGQPGATALIEEEQLPTTEEGEEEEEEQQQQPLTVTTDRESYSTDDTIVITGTVAERQPGSRASITVIDPQSNIVWRESVMVTANNTYQLEIEAGERQYSISPFAIDTSGTYLVTASYRAERAETTFEFTSEEGG